MAKSSTAVATRNPKAGALTSWEQQMAAAAQDTAAAEAKVGAARWLSIKGGMMTLGGGAIPDSKMKSVILDSVFENAYYGDEDYDPNNPKAPICFAFSRTGDGMEPHEESQEKQHTDCASCPMNKFKSAKNKKGKACKNIRRLALIPDTALESEKSVSQAEWIGLKVPVTSVANWANYAKSIAASYKRPPFGMVTEIGCRPDPKNQVVVTFQAIDTIKANIGGAVLAKRESILEDLVQPYSPREEEEAPPPARKPGAKRKY